MIRKPDDLELEYILELAKSSQKVQDLLKQKYKAIDDITGTISFKKYEPAPSPKGDIRLIKTHIKSVIGDKYLKEEIAQVKYDFNHKIKMALEEKAFEQDKDYIYPIIQSMDEESTALLLEKGKEDYKNNCLEASLSYDIDEITDKFKSLYLDFKENERDMDKSTSPSDDYE